MCIERLFAADSGDVEVLFSQAMVDLSDNVAVAYREVGMVALKGVTGDTHLYLAHRPH